jgi:hypothetical protein
VSAEPVFSRRVLAGWAAAATALFAISLYLMGGGELTSPEGVLPSTFSRSAIGHAGIAEVLQRLDIVVVKSRQNSLDQLSRGSVLVIAEPRSGDKSEEMIRTLVKAETILFVLPKRTGRASEKKAEWLGQAGERSIADAQGALRLLVPRGEVMRQGAPAWTANVTGIVPSLAEPIQLMRSDRLTPIIAAGDRLLVGEIREARRRVWVLSDPDVIANHGLARPGNAALAVALIERLRGAGGSVVFDETVHGYTARSSNPFLLLFQFPFIVATAQIAIAALLVLWAAMGRFGAPEPMPPALSAGRQGLLQNMAKLIAFSGHESIMVRRYVQETIRTVARQLHAPAGLSGEPLLAWLARVGLARGVRTDCGEIARSAELLETGRRNFKGADRIAREIYRWKREMMDGPSRHTRAHGGGPQ